MHINGAIHAVFLILVAAWFIHGLYLYHKNRIMIKEIDSHLKERKDYIKKNTSITMDLGENKMYSDGYSIESCLAKMEDNIPIFKMYSGGDIIKYKVTLEGLKQWKE